MKNNEGMLCTANNTNAETKSHYLISAIVSVYNCEKFIDGCLKDLQSQTIANTVQIVIVNSGSMQNEESIIRRYQERYSNILYLKTQERETIYKAWNRGIKASSGKYITNANSDDRHRKDAFEIMSAILESNSNIDLVYPSYRLTHHENVSFYDSTDHELIKLPDYSRDELLFRCTLGPFPMWRKSLHNQFGFFDEGYEVAGDYDFWLRISGAFNIFHVNEFLGLYYKNPTGGEFRNPILTKSEIVNVVNNYLDKRYIKEIKSNHELVRIIKKKQSDFNFWAADYFYLNKRTDLAKHYAMKSLSYKHNYMKNLKLIFYCMLTIAITNLSIASVKG